MGKKVKITIYKTPTCPYCLMAEQYFDSLGLPYTSYDVTQDPAKGQEMIAKSGQTGVPVIVIEKNGEEKVFVGFDQAGINEFLGIQT